MTVAVASDAHGDRRRMDALLAVLPGVDAFCFLGDMDRDAEYLMYGLEETQPRADFYAVAGNNDPFSRRPSTLQLQMDSVHIMVTHGHLFRGVRTTQQPMAMQAGRLGCTLVLYGHTHVQKDQMHGAVRCVNPGALMQGEWALLTLEGGEARVALQSLDVG